MSSASAAQRALNNKRWLYPRLQTLAESTPENLKAHLRDVYADNAHWRGSHPLNEHHGIDAVAENVWQPLLRAMPDLERRDDLFLAGTYEGRDLVAAMGHYCGIMREDFLGIPATGRPVYLRYGEVYHVENGQVMQSSCLWDIMDLMRQCGFWPVAPSLGTEGRWPGPLTADGVVMTLQDEAEGASSLAATLAMHKALGDYDDLSGAGREGLLTMPQKKHWHPKMMWYGPSGIGTTRALQGFVDYHQLPFRIAFPNRQGGAQLDGGTPDEIASAKDAQQSGHYIRIGDGKFSVTGGWPSVVAMHRGGGFLGATPTNKPVSMRVMDFYHHHEGLIRENWVPLDCIDLLLQMGIDVFDRMQSHFKRGRIG